ncbi:DUF2634 domain-containing protein [Acidaminobacter sp. JC074]|uniref:DUF2634 domain-containing protein n=1 Tax=Acidaminobacter sp. JC074 TaxID=2530199 RepID=UPI001F116F49|nr:DUF2634 domain-containing protein [Acidaminobacter sp. JC074]MCH4891174.1 DUF2634 domain-containing protein [Acidaminobacter sp. JC074]
MLPVVPITTVEKKEDSDQKGIVYKFDFKLGSYALEDGNLVELTSVEDQVKQWLQFFINTELNAYSIYEGLDFGLNLKKYIGQKTIPLGLIASEISDQLDLGIRMNDDIKEVTSVKVTKENEILRLSISVKISNNTIVEVIS